MEMIGDYQITRELSGHNAGFSVWGYAKKNSREYFIKEFLEPKYPEDNEGLSPDLIKRKRQLCDSFYKERTHFYNTLRECRTGNNVVVEDFFRAGAKYYAVTDRVYEEPISIEQIAEFNTDQKTVLTRSLLYSVAAFHEKGIIHADLKPENILISKTKGGYYTGKIIDFDAGFLSSAPPQSIDGDFVYYAPEVFLYNEHEDVKLTEKIDVFALGLLLHQYWTGKLPEISEENQYVFLAVLNDEHIRLSNMIPDRVRKMIGRILVKNPEDRPTAKEALEILANPLYSV